MEPLLAVKGLSVWADQARILEDVSIQIAPGEAVGLAGESGSGKSTLALAIMRLLRPPLRQQAEAIVLRPPGADEINIHRRTARGMEQVRWRHISLVFQAAMNALNPCQRIDAQLAEAFRLHAPGTIKDAVDTRVREILDLVGVDHRRHRAFPHQLSGGQRQRVMIALALVCNPSLIIADEPSTALDVMTQAQILDLLERLRETMGLAVLFITHDLSVIAETCDRVAIMYAGRIVEEGAVDEVFESPEHPYTAALLAGSPDLDGERVLPAAIPGTPPDPRQPVPGCSFHNRCSFAQDICRDEVPILEPAGAHRQAACHFAPWPAGHAIHSRTLTTTLP